MKELVKETAKGPSPEQQEPQEKQNDNNHAILVPKLPIWLNNKKTTDLSKEISMYLQFIEQKLEAPHQKIMQVFEYLNTVLTPPTKLICYGSFACGPWLPSSDVDLVLVDFPADHSHHLPLFIDKLTTNNQSDSIIQSVKVIPTAKIPLLKIVCQNDVEVDLSFHSLDDKHQGIEATCFIKRMIATYPILHACTLILKQFLREKALNDASTGGISSYTIFLLVLHYFHLSLNSSTTIAELLLGFLEYYGLMFEYTTTGISILMMREYELKDKSTKLMPILVVDDPVAPGRNAAAGTFALPRVITAFENAFYAIRFHQPTQFTPTPLSQLIHWSGIFNK